MRALTLIGLVLIAAGAYVLARGYTITTKRDVLQVGDFKVSADEQRPIPAWAAALAVAGGVALVFGGLRKRA